MIYKRQHKAPRTIQRVLITGATGSIGMALIAHLLQQEVQVYVMVRPDSARKQALQQFAHVHIVECDLAHIDTVPQYVTERMDVFYHFAWENTVGAQARDDMFSQIQNIQYTLQAVHVAKALGCHTFIGAGSQAEYGRSTVPLSATTPTFPENGYGMAKLCAGQMSAVEAKKLGINHIWTRILSVYGQYDAPNSLVKSVLASLHAGERVHTTAGEQVWDLIAAEDVAEIFYLLGKHGKDGKIYPIGCGDAKTLKDYIKDIQQLVDKDAVIGFGDIAYSPNQVMYLVADTRELCADTGFQLTATFAQRMRAFIKTLYPDM